MNVRFTCIKERVTAAPGNSLLTKVVSCTVSVVKADCEAATNHVRKGDKYFCGYQYALFGKSICYLSVGLYVWKYVTATSEKWYPSRIL